MINCKKKPEEIHLTNESLLSDYKSSSTYKAMAFDFGGKTPNKMLSKSQVKDKTDKNILDSLDKVAMWSVT